MGRDEVRMQCIVVIPVYQPMNEMEKISLRQAVHIFRNEPLCLVAPASLDLFEYRTYGDFRVERFDDQYFRKITTYTKLLLSEGFYERFSAYRFLLIYQLDAFAFRDELPYFCSLGYDYFGAPWPLMEGARRLTGNPVGNGGFSLRHVGHTIAVLRRYHEVLERDWLSRADPHGEDLFFGWAAMQEGSDYKTAPLDLAMTFSLECDVRHAFRHLDEDHLPFGIHKWYQMDFQTWRPQIERCGYRIDPSDPHIRWTTTQDKRRERIWRWAMWQHLPKVGDPMRMHALVREILPSGQPLYLRGHGKVAQKVQAFLKRARICWAGVLEQGMPLPEKTAFLLVASTKYEAEISAELMQAGRKEGRDFLTSWELEDRFVRKYYGRC